MGPSFNGMTLQTKSFFTAGIWAMPLVVACMSSSALAATKAELDRLYVALGTPDLIAIMRQEGLIQVAEMEAETFGDRGGGPAWDAAMDRIYSVDQMSETFRVGFDAGLAGVDVAPLLAFFEGDIGKEVVSLEIAGREAFLDETVEAAAEDVFADMDDTARKEALTTFIEQNDLIELNVMGGLNSSLAFYRGMADGGLPLDQDQVLQDVWAQEPEIRASTETWIYAYLNLSYEPLTPEELGAYIEITGSDAGRALNSALFDGFDKVFIDISRALGRAVVVFGQGEDL